MHRSLTLVEVQRAVFREIHDVIFWGGKAQIARLACVCRTFHNIALDILWEELPSIVCLVQCLPQDLWEVDRRGGVISFQRPMSDRDWEIFFRYSSRIRSLSAIDPDEGRIGRLSLIQSFYDDHVNVPLHLGDDVIVALSRPPSNRPLVPNLNTLSWTEQDEKYAPLLQLLLPHSLVNLTVPSFALWSPALSSHITTRCPSLKKLHPRLCKSNIGRRQTLSETLWLLRSLESVEYHALDEDAAIIALSQLPLLVELSGRFRGSVYSHKVKHFLEMTPHPFPSLESLTLVLFGDDPFAPFTSLLQLMQFKLKKMSLILHTSPTSDKFRLFFILLVNALDSERLSHISVITRPTFWDAHRYQLSLSTFEPLFALPNVTFFKFDVTCELSFDDHAIDKLTTHWPRLVTLSLNPTCGWRIESDVTHMGLITLLSRCPSLTDIALEVDFVGVDRDPEYMPSSRLGDEIVSHCERADFVGSKIEVPASIAAFLSDICPTLKEVTSAFWDTIHSETDEDSPYGFSERWVEVNRWLPGFLAVRRQCMDLSGARGE